MFARSAAPDTLQGKAIQAVNERWGDKDEVKVCGRQSKGRESIGIPVCKKKYKPFQFHTVTKKDDGTVVVTVERLYACRCHHELRKKVIEKHGVRAGWQPFGVWSLAKAQAQARRETIRLNAYNNDTGTSATDEESSSDESLPINNANTKIAHKKPHRMCMNGNCTWKVRSAYDNIYKEIHGESEGEE